MSCWPSTRSGSYRRGWRNYADSIHLVRAATSTPEWHHGKVNTLRIADGIYLLVHGTGGTAHLAAEQRSGGRAAFLDDDFERAGKRGWEGEDAALREPRWSPKSLCGNEWGCMSPTEETSSFFYWDVEEVFAPGCRKCLRKLDRHFPEAAVAPAVFILAELAAEKVLEFGSAEIEGVPGDQVEPMRKYAKKSVRARGFRCRSLVSDDVVVISSDEAYEAIPRETKLARLRQVVDAIEFIADGETSLSQPPPSRLRWTTWDVCGS